MFFGIVGILENSAFHFSVEKGRSPLILKKISGFEGEKMWLLRVFGHFRGVKMVIF